MQLLFNNVFPKELYNCKNELTIADYVEKNKLCIYDVGNPKYCTYNASICSNCGICKHRTRKVSYIVYAN